MKLLTINLRSRISVPGAFVSAIMIIGLMGPWLTVSYNSYPMLNPDTRTGQLFFRSTVQLSPFFGSLIEDEALIARYWFISSGTTLGGLLIAVSSILSAFKHKASWTHFSLFLVALLGTIVFFLSIGEGISLGVITQIGWGLKLTAIGLLLFFIVSFMELSRNSVSRFMD